MYIWISLVIYLSDFVPFGGALILPTIACAAFSLLHIFCVMYGNRMKRNEKTRPFQACVSSGNPSINTLRTRLYSRYFPYLAPGKQEQNINFDNFVYYSASNLIEQNVSDTKGQHFLRL